MYTRKWDLGEWKELERIKGKRPPNLIFWADPQCCRTLRPTRSLEEQTTFLCLNNQAKKKEKKDYFNVIY